MDDPSACAGPTLGLVVETSCRYLADLRFRKIVTAGLDLERLGTFEPRLPAGPVRAAETPATVATLPSPG